MKAHCCEEMRRQAEHVCDQHPDRFECPDCLVHYSERFQEYGLIVHDGGSSVVRIRFCPWCGAELPESLRPGEQKFSPGWDEARVRRLIDHYDNQDEDAQVAEDEAAQKAEGQTVMVVPTALVPAIRELLARKPTG
jgi:hypothetical protein